MATGAPGPHLDSAVKAMKRKPYVQLKTKTQVTHKSPVCSSVWSRVRPSGGALQAWAFSHCRRTHHQTSACWPEAPRRHHQPKGLGQVGQVGQGTLGGQLLRKRAWRLCLDSGLSTETGAALNWGPVRKEAKCWDTPES